MLKKKLTVLTALSLAASLALAGCGTTGSTAVEGGGEEEPIAEEPAEEEETVEVEEPVEEEAPDEEVSEEYISYNIADLLPQQENMLGPMDTVATCQTEDGPTDFGDSEEVWTALYLLVVNYSELFDGRIEFEGNNLYVTEDVLLECASAMFADFDGTLPEGGMGNITKDGDRYCLPGSDRGDSYARISSWTDNPDGSCTVEIQELIESEKEITQEYRIELVGNQYAESGEDALFVYSVESVEKTFQKEWDETGDSETGNDETGDSETGNDETGDSGTENDEAGDSGTEVGEGGYVLPESDSRYYSESELSALSKDELRLARNEIYARHGRRFDSEDLQTYFNGKSWYQGTVDPADFSAGVFNEFEKANIKTIEAVEAAQSENASD